MARGFAGARMARDGGGIVGKRSDFNRRERDFYPTPREAVDPLLPHISHLEGFMEPCAGDGSLIQHLERFKHVCLYASDIEPRAPKINRLDVMDYPALQTIKNNYDDLAFITNPPWPALGQSGDPTIAMALRLSDIAPTWFLLSADFAHNKYFERLAKRCIKIVSVGRVKWIPDSPHTGKDNCAWYLFDPTRGYDPTAFYGRGYE